MEIYPIATKIKHGELQGVITAISIRGRSYSVLYGVTIIYKDGSSEEKFLYDFEFTAEVKKDKWGLRIV